MENSLEKALKDKLEVDFIRLYGPVLTGIEVQELLRYRSEAAFRKAMTRQSIPVPLFEISGQRGKFALASDIASYLAKQRLMATEHETDDE